MDGLANGIRPVLVRIWTRSIGRDARPVEFDGSVRRCDCRPNEGDYREDPPHEMVCPITGVPFREPVVANDRHTCEREAILAWLRINPISPFTGSPMRADRSMLVPDRALRSAVRKWERDNAIFMRLFIEDPVGGRRRVEVARDGSCSAGCILRMLSPPQNRPLPRKVAEPFLVFEGVRLNDRAPIASHGIGLWRTVCLFFPEKECL